MADEMRLRATRDLPGIRARLVDGGYVTRRLKAGDEFYVPTVLGELIVHKMGRAEPSRAIGSVPPPPKHLATKLRQLDHDHDGRAGGSAKQAGGGVAAARERYFKALGKRPFNGWDEAELNRRIDAAGK